MRELKRLNQIEIDEISDAFLEAWQEYFGTIMYYVPFKEGDDLDDTYLESKAKVYDMENKIRVHGTIREIQSEDKSLATGKQVQKFFEITLVTKELIDGGLQRIDTNALIIYTDRFNKEYNLCIYDDFQKVQLVDNKIFTKLLVRTR